MLGGELKHDMAVSEAAREALSPAWQMVQGSSTQEEQTAPGAYQASGEEIAEEKVSFF